MIILSWNVRDLGDSLKRYGINNFCQLSKVDMVCFQESKLGNIDNSILRSLGGILYQIGNTRMQFVVLVALWLDGNDIVG